jgi:hypothetical protein
MNSLHFLTPHLSNIRFVITLPCTPKCFMWPLPFNIPLMFCMHEILLEFATLTMSLKNFEDSNYSHVDRHRLIIFSDVLAYKLWSFQVVNFPFICFPFLFILLSCIIVCWFSATLVSSNLLYSSLNWRTTPCLLSAIAYSLYPHLPFVCGDLLLQP